MTEKENIAAYQFEIERLSKIEACKCPSCFKFNKSCGKCHGRAFMKGLLTEEETYEFETSRRFKRRNYYCP